MSKSILTSCLLPHISQICAKNFKTESACALERFLKLKVTNGELIISDGLEMVENYLQGGGTPGAPPPAWFCQWPGQKLGEAGHP